MLSSLYAKYAMSIIAWHHLHIWMGPNYSCFFDILNSKFCQSRCDVSFILVVLFLVHFELIGEVFAPISLVGTPSPCFVFKRVHGKEMKATPIMISSSLKCQNDRIRQMSVDSNGIHWSSGVRDNLTVFICQREFVESLVLMYNGCLWYLTHTTAYFS